MKELSDRQKIILSLVVHEHTRTAQPVASKSLLKQYNLKISSATIRNEMNTLEEMGFLRQPHTSAGRVPTEEGYRFFVTNLVQHTSLPSATRNMIAHQFYQARRGLDYWLPLAASVLANQSQAVSIVTAPHTQKVTFKHLELIATRGSQVLMVLVLVGGEIQQQIISFETGQTQEALSQLANQVNQLCENRTIEQISNLPPSDAANINLVLDAIKEQLSLANKLVTGELYLDGLSYVLGAPGFVDNEPANSPLKLLEERSMLDDLISRTVLTEDIGGVQVLIGGEGTWQELQNYSVILTRYGIPDQLSGTLGILGPMRMPYRQTISTVRYVGELMSGFVSDNLID